MKKCITCGQEIKDDALFCPYCGTRNQGDEQGAATAQDTVQDNSVNDNQAENSSDDTVTADEAAQNIANDPFAYNRMNLGQARQVPPMQQYQPQQQVPPMQQYLPQQQVPPMQQYQPQKQVPPMQQMYQPRYGTANTAWQDTNDQPLSVGGWITTMIILMIPVVNFIMLLVWAFGSGNKSRKNYCLASLIIAVVMIALIMVFYIAFGLSAASAFNTMYY